MSNIYTEIFFSIFSCFMVGAAFGVTYYGTFEYALKIGICGAAFSVIIICIAGLVNGSFDE